MAFSNVIPYSCVYIDAGFKEILRAAKRCFSLDSPEARTRVTSGLGSLFTSSLNPNHVLPCLSVRTGFDLFCLAMNFAPGSEIIMSAVNIPSISAIAQQHGLKVVPWDIGIDTLAPKAHLLPQLITSSTVAVVVAHIYGTILDVSKFISICHHHGLWFVEDCAEAFGGLDYIGHPSSDLALFSFGIIKFQTAFGGAVAKVRSGQLYRLMSKLQDGFAVQSNAAYFRKLAKYGFIFMLLNSPRFMEPGMVLGKKFGWDYQTFVVNWLRGFKSDALDCLRQRPSLALLETLRQRLSIQSQDEYAMTRNKAQYVVKQLAGHVKVVGLDAPKRNFWLFPVVVDDPEKFSALLNSMGVDAYRGATQLDVIISKCHVPHHSCEDCSTKPVDSDIMPKDGGRTAHIFAKSLSLKSFDLPNSFPVESTHNLPIEDDLNTKIIEPSNNSLVAWPMCCPKFPSEAKYLIDHVVYLPVHKNVPFKCLDQICEFVKLASCVCRNLSSPHSNVQLKSKL